jgi:DNA-directed RNA polymerase specialized sigma24 family protein
METREARQQIDKLLLPFIQATDEEDSQRLLTLLVSDHADPIIKSIVRHKLHLPFGYLSESRLSEDAEEISSEILVQVLSRLRELKEKPDEKNINNFRSYVASITYSVWHEHLRQKYPQRHTLKNKLRYLLTHRSSFAVWEGEDREHLCGFAAWENQKRTPSGARRIQELRGSAQAAEKAGLTSNDLQRLDLASLLSAVFRWVGSCVDLDDLVNVVAGWTGVDDQVYQGTVEEEVDDPFERLPDPRPNIDVELQHRTHLQRLWLEIRQLKPQQRAALLLNLRDSNGGDVVAVFVIAGITTIHEIAYVLAMSAEQLATLWNDLPLDDLTIAGRLGITRQQVINLRKSARERLARRTKGF